MKGIILAAGKGTRVRPLTRDVPKPMIPILHKPVMEFLVDLLARHGVRQILVNTSYLAESIEQYFREGSRFGVQMAYSFEGRLENGRLIDEPLGSAGALRRIQDHAGFFDDVFVALCGDAVIDLDLTALAEFHRRRRALATIALLEVPRQEVGNYGVVVRDSDGRVTAFQEKPAPAEARSIAANTGVYVFDPAILDWIPGGEPYDIGSQLFPRLVESGAPMYATVIPFQWLDIGRLPDYLAVVRMALKGQVHGFRVPGRSVAPGVWTGLNVRLESEDVSPPVYIGGGSTIQAGATIIGPAAIGAGCLVEAGAHIERSVVLDYTRVGGGLSLVDMVACGRYCAGADGVVVEPARARLDSLIADARGPRPALTAEEEAVFSMLAAARPAA